ncbi:MAG: glycosyltransferase [Lachnospiraceae bacterium]|nr:glycosyltransferase [Lachnospiraceae bacterium]
MKEGITVIIPFLNEESGIEAFCRAFDEYAATVSFPIEAIFVNDGSTDASPSIVRGFKFSNLAKCRLINFSRNFGSHAGYRAGIKNASYDICTWVAADLQDPFELIDISYEKIVKDEADAVYVGRSTYEVPFFTKLFSHMYSTLMQKYAVPKYEPGGYQTIVFNRKIIDYLNENMESNSSILLQIVNAGFRSEVIHLDFTERKAGRSKWSLSKKVKLAIDSFVAFSFMPIRLVSLVGVIMFIAGALYGVWVIINKFISTTVVSGYSTLACLLALGFGVTNISLGVIAEYLWRAYDASMNRPVFIISEIVELKS